MGVPNLILEDSRPQRVGIARSMVWASAEILFPIPVAASRLQFYDKRAKSPGQVTALLRFTRLDGAP